MRFLIVLALCLPFGHSIGEFSPEFVEKIDSLAEAIRECYGIPALSVAIVDLRDGGQKTLAKGYGVCSTIDGEPVTSSTKFALGSIGKSITATAIGLHMERAQDNITYDTTIASLIHPWRFSDDEELNRYANLRDILSHRTAQPSHDGSLFMGNERTREDILREIHRLPTIASVTKSNGTYHYSCSVCP